MTSSRLRTKDGTRQVTVDGHTATGSIKPDITTDPFKLMKNAEEGIGDDGELGHDDADAAARIKAKNHDKINIFPETGCRNGGLQG